MKVILEGGDAKTADLILETGFAVEMTVRVVLTKGVDNNEQRMQTFVPLRELREAVEMLAKLEGVLDGSE